MDALAFALTFLDRLPGLIQAGADIAQLIREHREMQDLFKTEKRDPNAQEWAALNDRLDALEKRLQT